MPSLADQSATYYFRPYVETDYEFIQSSWGSSYYKGRPLASLVSPEDFHKKHREIRTRVLKSPEAAFIICCSSEDSNVILGWICIERLSEDSPLLLHYVYVKEAFKAMGIGAELIQASLKLDKAIIFTHLTKKAAKILKNNREKYMKFYYVPHLA